METSRRFIRSITWGKKTWRNILTLPQREYYNYILFFLHLSLKLLVFSPWTDLLVNFGISKWPSSCRSPPPPGNASLSCFFFLVPFYVLLSLLESKIQASDNSLVFLSDYIGTWCLEELVTIAAIFWSLWPCQWVKWL